MKSIYERIDAVVKEFGCVPDDYVLEQAVKPGDIQTKYMGELEGIIGPPVGQADKVALEKAVKMLKDNININAKLAVHSFDDNDLGFSVAKIQGHLLKEIIDNVYDYDPHKLSTLAYSLVNFGTKLETVKLGLLILILFDFADDEIVKRHLITLGLYEEFTSYVVSIAKGWSDESKNHVYYIYAQKLKGFGKINALNNLVPVNEEVREWILCHGCENEISLSYLGKAAADKCRFVKRLEEGGFNEEEMQGARNIMLGLLDESKAEGISAMRDPVKVGALYLKEVSKHTMCLHDVAIMYDLKDYLTNKDDKSDAATKELVVSQIDKVIGTSRIESIVKAEVMNNPMLAISTAKKCGFDVTGDLIANLRKDFDLYYKYCEFLLENEISVDEIIGICKDNLTGRGFPEGMGEDVITEEMPRVWDLPIILRGLGGLPGKGSELVVAGINSSILDFRNSAADLILKWENDEKGNVKKICPDAFHAIKKLKKKEVNDTLKKKWDDILNYK